jgi:ketosteroid isomerase-like protein
MNPCSDGRDESASISPLSAAGSKSASGWFETSRAHLAAARYWQPMSQENVEIVRTMYEAFNRGDYSTALESIDPDIEVNVASRGMFDGVHRGHDGLSKMLADFWTEFEGVRMEIEEWIPAGDDVVAVAHARGRGKVSGIEVDVRMGQVWTLRDGKAVRWQIFEGRDAALEAAGLSQ